MKCCFLVYEYLFSRSSFFCSHLLIDTLNVKVFVVLSAECSSGTWGGDCSLYCSCGTGADHCDPKTGCVCKNGFTG